MYVVSRGSFEAAQEITVSLRERVRNADIVTVKMDEEFKFEPKVAFVGDPMLP